MMNKRHVATGLLAGFASAFLVKSSGNATGAISEKEAKAALMTWLDALASHEPDKVEKLLAPEFQIMRSNGSGYGRKDYLRSLPKFAGKPEFRDFVATSDGDVLVARYNLRLEQKILNKSVQQLAPRLSVMRKVNGTWLMVAHANFAQIG